MTLRFSHLQVHSHYSVVEGLCRIEDIASRASDLGIESVALTDIDNMFCWVKFYHQMRAVGVKPIAGADVLLVHESLIVPVTILCLRTEGYHQLMTLLS